MAVQKTTFQGCIPEPTFGFGGLAIGGEGVQPFITVEYGGLAIGGESNNPFITSGYGGLAIGGEGAPIEITFFGGLAVGGQSLSPLYPDDFGGLAIGGAKWEPQIGTLHYQTTGTGFTNSMCSDCNLLNATITCPLNAGTNYSTSVPLCAGASPITVQIDTASPAGTLLVAYSTCQWTVSTAGWDFFSPIVVGNAFGIMPNCATPPATVTVNGIYL